MSSPTQRALATLRKQGITAQVVERWNSFARKKVDLFNFIDIVAVSPDGGITGLQVTSDSNHAKRRNKILAEPKAKEWIKAGGRIEVWSYGRKGKAGKRKIWTLRKEEIGVGDFGRKIKITGMFEGKPLIEILDDKLLDTGKDICYNGDSTVEKPQPRTTKGKQVNELYVRADLKRGRNRGYYIGVFTLGKNNRLAETAMYKIEGWPSEDEAEEAAKREAKRINGKFVPGIGTLKNLTPAQVAINHVCNVSA